MSFFERLTSKTVQDNIERKLWEIKMENKFQAESNKIDAKMNQLEKMQSNLENNQVKAVLDMRETAYAVRQTKDEFENNMLRLAEGMAQIKNDTIQIVSEGINAWDRDKDNVLNTMLDITTKYENHADKTMMKLDHGIQTWKHLASESLDVMQNMNKEFDFKASNALERFRLESGNALNSMKEIGISSIKTMDAMNNRFKLESNSALHNMKEMGTSAVHSMKDIYNNTQSLYKDFQVDKTKTIEGLRGAIQQEHNERAKFLDIVNMKGKEFDQKYKSASSNIENLYSQVRGKLKEETFSSLGKIQTENRRLDSRESKLNERDRNDRLELNQAKSEFQKKIDALREANKEAKRKSDNFELAAEQNLRRINEQNAYIAKQQKRRPSFRYGAD